MSAGDKNSFTVRAVSNLTYSFTERDFQEQTQVKQRQHKPFNQLAFVMAHSLSSAGCNTHKLSTPQSKGNIQNSCTIQRLAFREHIHMHNIFDGTFFLNEEKEGSQVSTHIWSETYQH